MRSRTFAPCGLALAGLLLASGCGGGASTAQQYSDQASDQASHQQLARIGSLGSAVVYGEDDRLEYFEIGDAAAQHRLSSSVVALAAAEQVRETAAGYSIDAASWGELQGLCPGEPFADQPAVAFCSGVLVDWDLVLVAGHCAHALPLQDVVVLFDYYYREPGDLALGARDVVRVSRVEHQARDLASAEPRLDYAWLRLAEPQAAPREPAPVYVTPPALALGDDISVIAAGGGVPLKLDGAGRVHDLGEPSLGYFVANTDTSQGASGAGAFDRNLALLGILARGKPDFVRAESGCLTTAREAEADAAEEFTYAFQAVAGLCAGDPEASALCRADCEEPCSVGPPPWILVADDCSYSPRRGERALGSVGLALLLGTAALRARRRRT